MSPQSTFYITTPIYYVNGRPHIGHAYTSIAADTAARWHRLKGDRVFFLTGTDEHGQKVLEKANERGMTPQEHVDDMVQHWKATFERLHISHDRFFRTTDADHIANVQSALTWLYERDLLYKAEYTGWYHVGDEIFVTEKDIEDGKYDRDDLQQISESNWWFRMSRFQQQLLEAVEGSETLVQPASRRNEVLGFLRTKTLTDLCISRPKERMAWGIELPFDTDFVTYVWFDALLNYLTATGFNKSGDGSVPAGFAAWSDLWPADFQLIGKDILTTHAVYWTTMLMALEVPLPKTLFAHGWWVSADGQKMSKSKGNVIDVDLLTNEFGVDAARYFFLREIRFGNDGQFSYDSFLNRYNADLANDLGNLAHRALSMTTKWLGGVIPEFGPDVGNVAELRQQAAELIGTYDTGLCTLRFDTALEALWELVKGGNKYIEDTAPWALNREGKTAELQTAKRTVLEIVYLAAVLLLPVLPNKAIELLEKVGRNEAAARHDLTRLLEDPSAALNLLPAGMPIAAGDPLFPRFDGLPESIQALFAAPEAEPKLSKKQKKQQQKKKAAAPIEPISFDDFEKVNLRSGQITAAEVHPDADRLLVLQVDIGEAKPRQIVAGIASRFSPGDLIGRRVVVVANLKPAKLRGVLSEGMLLAAGGKEVIDLVSVGADPGEVVR